MNSGIRGKTIALVSTVILIVSISCVLLLIRQQKVDLEQRIGLEKKGATAVLQVAVDQIQGQYTARLQSLVHYRRSIVDAFAARKRHLLYSRVLPVFNLLRKENPSVRRMCFILPDGTAFLRVHNPEIFGDRIPAAHPMFIDINRFHKPMSGFEAGKEGVYFRVVQPIFYHGKYIGFLHLGVRSSYFTAQLRRYLGYHAAISLNREQAAKIRPDTATRFTVGTHVLFPGEDQFFLRRGRDLQITEDGVRMSFDNRYFDVFPAYVLRDGQGREIGRLLVAIDIDDLIVRYHQVLYKVVGLGLLLLFSAGLILYFSFRRILGEVLELNRLLEEKNSEYDRTRDELQNRIEQSETKVGQITDRLKDLMARHETTNRSLQKSLDEWKRTFDAIRDPVLILDSDLFVLKANRSASLLLGKDPQHIKGIHCYELFAGRKTPCPRCPTREVLLDGRAHEREVDHPYLGKTFLVSCAPITIDGELVGFVYTAKDISHQRNLEKQLVQVQKMEAIATLAGGIAHDFNNILGAILGNADLLLYRIPRKDANGNMRGDESLGFDEVAEHVEAIKRAGARAKELVSQILAFSRQSTSKRRNVVITPVIKEAVKLLRSSLPAYIEVKIEIAAEIGQIYADPTQVHQILMNLCTNAAQAIEDAPGTIEISLREIEAGTAERLRYHDLAEGRYVVLSVRDTGKGMSREIMERIFDPFFTTRQVGEGTGMGLAVLHGIVVAHDGVIDVQSEVGKGSVFTVFFPRVDDADITQTDSITAMPRGNETILFVDDEEDIVKMRTRMLEFLGYTVFAATTPEQALATMKSHSQEIDLVITDHSMPRMSGLQLAGEITKIRGDIPIILCSGYSEAVTTDEARNVGIRRFLAKPLDMRLLATAIRELLSTRE